MAANKQIQALLKTALSLDPDPTLRALLDAARAEAEDQQWQRQQPSELGFYWALETVRGLVVAEVTDLGVSPPGVYGAWLPVKLNPPSTPR